jgi:hypothetical protein
MGFTTRIVVFCSVVIMLHIGRFVAEYLYYHNCASSVYSLLFTSGSTSCVALRSVSTSMSTNMGVFATAVLNSLLLSLGQLQNQNFDINVQYCLDSARRFVTGKPSISQELKDIMPGLSKE